VTGGGRTGPGRARAIDAVRARRRSEQRQDQALEAPLVYRNGKIALRIDPMYAHVLIVDPSRGLGVDFVKLKEELDALP